MGVTLDFNSLTTGWIGFFAANSSTLDSNLYKSITTIIDADPEDVNLYISRMPGITINLVDHDEERNETYGNGVCRKHVVCHWQIGAHIYNIGDYTTARKNMKTLVSNVEKVIRSDDTASGTFHNIEIDSATFGVTIQGNKGTYQQSAIINVDTDNYV